jgi:hypothetical protein
VLKRGEGKSLTTSQLEKAGAVAHTKQLGVGKLVKVGVGGKLHRRGGKTHFLPEKPGAVSPPPVCLERRKLVAVVVMPGEC